MKIWIFQRFRLVFLVMLMSLQVTSMLSARELPQTVEEYEAEKNLDQLLLLIQKRLAIMHEVARTKWNHNLPIEDKAREKQLLTDIVTLANKRDLDEKWIHQFFEAQIEAAKLIQKNDFELWRKQGVQKFESVLDLKTQLRSYIDQINQEFLAILSVMQAKNYNKFEGRFLLDAPISNRPSDHVDQQVWQLATSPFGS